MSKLSNPEHRHETADAVVLMNGRIRTLDPRNTVASAIAMRNGRILGTGGNAEMLALAGPAANRVDLGGRTVLPGLIDAHIHFEAAALHLTYFADCHVPPHRDLKGILNALSERASQTPPGEWVIGQGSYMLAEKLIEHRYPTLAEMDQAVRGHPALIRVSLHRAVANTEALRRTGIDSDYKPPRGADVIRDAQGKPTGMLIEMWDHLGLPPFSHEQMRHALSATAMRLSSLGVTSIQEQIPSTRALRIYQELKAEGQLPIRMIVTVLVRSVEETRTFLRYGLQTGFGDDMIKLGAVKLFVDGGITGSAAAFHEDYRNQPGHRGHLRLDQEELNEIVRLVDEADCQLSIHAVGDLALDMTMNAFEALQRPRGMRHRIEHAGHLCMTQARINRMKKLNLIPVVSMQFLSAFGDFLDEILGPERASESFALRRMLDAGLIVAGSSDQMGSQPEGLNPFWGMWCCLAREALLGTKVCPDEAITLDEALKTYTTAAACAGFEEQVKGTLERGKYADLIVCDRDPQEITLQELKHFQPVATLLNGNLVSGSLDFSPSAAVR